MATKPVIVPGGGFERSAMAFAKLLAYGKDSILRQVSAPMMLVSEAPVS